MEEKSALKEPGEILRKECTFLKGNNIGKSWAPLISKNRLAVTLLVIMIGDEGS